MTKEPNNKKKPPSFTEKLSNDNVMPDGMLDSVSKTQMVILPIILNSPEGKIHEVHEEGMKDENR